MIKKFAEQNDLESLRSRMIKKFAEQNDQESLQSRKIKKEKIKKIEYI